MEEISLRDLYYVLRKWVTLIIILPIIAIIISGLISNYVIEPEYETFTTLMIGKPKDYVAEQQMEYNDLMLNQKLVSTYGEIVKSRLVTDKVIKNLDLELSYEGFRNKVNVNLVKDTEIIKIQVIDSDPELATKIANETAQVFMSGVKNIMKVENIQVIDLAQVPTQPIKPRKKFNMAIGAALGLMISIFLAFLAEFLDNSIKTPEDVQKHLGLPVLGAIPMIKN